jgi:hypothetical protein
LFKPVMFICLTHGLPDFLPHRPLRLLSSLLGQNSRKVHLSFAAININLRQPPESRLFDNLEREKHDNDNRRGQVSLEEALNLLTHGQGRVANWPCT